MKDKFPIIKAGFIFNEFKGRITKEVVLTKNNVQINYPCRLDAMAINPAAVCYNDTMVFTPGEVVVSLEKFINVKVKVLNTDGGILKISDNTRRKVLVKHAYLLMCKALSVHPSLEIEVIDKDIPKHCGFGSSSSTIASVAAAINELYDSPIDNKDLIKYLASNHGEEIDDSDSDNLKVVQCIGGGATNGLTDEGIIIIAGRSTTIAKMFYDSDVLIGFPKDFKEKDAKVMMELEEKNLHKFKKTGEKYSNIIAYNLLHKALPEMANGSIKSLSDIVFTYRFDMGSNENCSFVYDGLMDISDKIRVLYEENKCDFLALSSVGPAFFLLVNDKKNKAYCKKFMKSLNLKVIESRICNTKYQVVKEEDNCFWQDETTNKSFQLREPSKYITDEIDLLNISNKNCIDIGCGGGRYTRYLKRKKGIVLALDKYPEMFNKEIKVPFIKANMNKIPVLDNSYYLALSIGVIHNSVTEKEYLESLKEIYRILEDNGYLLISSFTNDVISSDLLKTSKNTYQVKNRPPMVLLSKKEINNYLKDCGFKIIKIVDEHITDVGSGERYVYTLLVQK